ncbi:MAG: hypothetical protein LBM98_04470 [Oscillospiraceae bacterium]|nr:hypothetical protein [Oscillospiraceae bacterium]
MYVNPGLLRRISLTTYRKFGGGFAMTVRRGGAPRAGQRPALSRRIAPGRWTRLRPRTARGGRV